MAARPKYEYRMICAQFGTRGHGTHAYRMPTDSKIRAQTVIDANHHSEMLADRNQNGRSSWYRNEAPWTIEKREIGKWETE